jgi:3-hydroxybutyryl-CoA dehydrogenase
MNCIVLASDENWQILTSCSSAINWKRVSDITSFLNEKMGDVYFNLSENSYQQDYSVISAPVIINSVTHSLYKIKAGKNIIRINAWPGFLEKEIWEVAGDIGEVIHDLITSLSKKYMIVSDEAGFVTARIIAMIINEAYYAKEEKVSTASEIDTAMKLGTNYPYGPFEWGDKIGLAKIYELLSLLSKKDIRYTPAASLSQEINKIS